MARTSAYAACTTDDALSPTERARARSALHEAASSRPERRTNRGLPIESIRSFRTGSDGGGGSSSRRASQ
jgi:hypothetical protein